MSQHSEDGKTYRRLRVAFLADNPTCWLCGHDGSNQIDHAIPRSVRRGRLEIWNWRPSHGPPGCSTCGQSCNQKRGTKPAMPQLWITSPDW